ncbi:MAG: hypothetical protein AAB534_00595 [Patescibacteria group bacterium]
MNPIIYLMIGVSVVVFLWGIVEFIAKFDSEEVKERGKRNMFWGLIGMFIMFGVFGIIRLILGTFAITPIELLTQ